MVVLTVRFLFGGDGGEHMVSIEGMLDRVTCAERKRREGERR